MFLIFPGDCRSFSDFVGGCKDTATSGTTEQNPDILTNQDRKGSHLSRNYYGINLFSISVMTIYGTAPEIISEKIDVMSFPWLLDLCSCWKLQYSSPLCIESHCVS